MSNFQVAAVAEVLVSGPTQYPCGRSSKEKVTVLSLERPQNVTRFECDHNLYWLLSPKVPADVFLHSVHSTHIFWLLGDFVSP